MIQEDAQVSQEAWTNFSSLLKTKFYSIVSNSSIDVGRTKFKMDIPTIGPLIAHKLYMIPLKHQKFVSEEICLLENAGCILQSLSLWTAQVIIVTKTPDPSHPNKQQLCLALNSQLLKSPLMLHIMGMRYFHMTPY